MLALKLQDQEQSFAEGFSALVKSKTDECALNLSDATLVEVLLQHEKYMRDLRPKYTNSAIISLIRGLNKMAGGEFLPMHVNGIFHNKVQRYLLEERELKKSTINAYLQKICAALTWAARFGCKLNPGYKDFNIKVEETPKLALTIEEVCLIYNFDIRSLTKIKTKRVRQKKWVSTECERNGKKYYRKIKKWVTVETQVIVPMFKKQHMEVLERVRDMFVLSCCLFQRYSDMRTLSPKNFSDDGSIYKVVQQKTGGKAVVSIDTISISSDMAYRILKKYNYHAPYNKSINNYNKHLHELIKLIGDRFLEEFSYDEKIMGEIKTFTKYLYEMITSHTARRTAITISTETQNEFDIREASGHKDGRSFARYINKRYAERGQGLSRLQ